MLEIFVGQKDLWNDEDEVFIKDGGILVRLEHSLFTISKWEAKYEKPFLSDDEKSEEELADYILFMVSGEIPEDFLNLLTPENTNKIRDYIQSKQTATWFAKKTESFSREVITSELIYYWMIGNNIPFECQHWHINRLLTLIRVCGEKNNPPKKRSRGEVLDENRRLNAERRAAMKTNG